MSINRIVYTLPLLCVVLASSCDRYPPGYDPQFDEEFLHRIRPVSKPDPIDLTMGARWELTTFDIPYGPRSSQSAASFQGKLWIIGGNMEREWKNDVWSSEDGLNWTLVTENAGWSPRSEHRTVVHDNKLWVMGGYNGELHNDVWFSEDGKNWQVATTEAPWAKRSHFRAVAFNDQIVVMGGQSDWKRHNDIWVSRDGVTWEELSTPPWRERSHFATVVHKDMLYLIGGSYFDYDIVPHPEYPRGSYMHLNDVWRTSDLVNWELMHDDYRNTGDKTTFNRRANHEVASIGGYIYMVNGDDHADVSLLAREVWLSEDGSTWRHIKRATSRLRIDRNVYFSLVVHDDKMFMLGGVHYGGARQNFRKIIMVSSGTPPIEGMFYDGPTEHYVQPGDDGFRPFWIKE